VRASSIDSRACSGVERHPGGAVGLVEVPAGRQRRAAIEHADVVEAEKAALEHVRAEAIFPIHPPGEIQQQFVEQFAHSIDHGWSEISPWRR
jgi:hypothetical protein